MVTGRSRKGNSNSSAWNSPALSRDQLFAAKREAVLREAARAFRDNGYHQTSLVDVARALNVTKPAVYYYFKSKEEILFQCHMFSIDLGEQVLQEVGFTSTTKTGCERLVTFLGRYIELVTSELGDLTVLSEVDALTEEHRRKVLSRQRQFDHRFRDLVAAGIADGSIRKVDPKLAVCFFMGPVLTLMRWYRPEGPLSGKQVAEAFVDLLVHGLKPRNGVSA